MIDPSDEKTTLLDPANMDAFEVQEPNPYSQDVNIQNMNAFSQNPNAQNMNAYSQNPNTRNMNAYSQNPNTQNMNAYSQNPNAQNMNVYNQNANPQNSYMANYSNMQMQNAGYTNVNSASAQEKKKISMSMILGIISSILLFVGLYGPAMDFSKFHEKIQIQYSLVKICKNVGLISSVWTGIPYGLLIAAIAMLVLSFVRIPQLKLIPFAIALIMFILMLLDAGNVIDWIKTIVEKYAYTSVVQTAENTANTIDAAKVISSFMIGVYSMVAGMIVGLVSSFFKE